MPWEITPASLREALSQTTPDPPANRTAARHPNARPAGILLPIRFDPTPHVVAMIRARALRDHGGEVAFAGGKQDRGETLLQTALRETEEELGVREQDVTPLGRLSPVTVITGRFVMHPFVGLLEPEVPLDPSPDEVEEVLTVPILPWLTGEAAFSAVEFPFEGRTLLLPHFPLEDAILYGASAYVFHELLVRLAQVHGRPLPTPRLESELPWIHRYPSR